MKNLILTSLILLTISCNSVITDYDGVYTGTAMEWQTENGSTIDNDGYPLTITVIKTTQGYNYSDLWSGKVHWLTNGYFYNDTSYVDNFGQGNIDMYHSTEVSIEKQELVYKLYWKSEYLDGTIIEDHIEAILDKQ